MQREVLCPYCGRPAETVMGGVLYPRGRAKWANRLYWRCVPCIAHVGTHQGTDKPLGSLAKPALRRMRRRAHEEFDQLWGRGKWPRRRAYQWLSARLGMPFADCHIGELDIGQCHAVIRAVRERKTGS